MKQLTNIRYVIFVLMLLYLQQAYCSVTIPINNQSCKYTITIPDGWDTIPKQILTQRLGQYPVDIAIFPTQQEEYFEANYVLINFIPTMKTLSEFQFKKIVEDVKNTSKQGIIQTDTIQVVYKKTESKSENENYHIYTYSVITKDSITLDCAQDLYLTKFGYISVMVYKKTGGTYSLSEILDTLFDKIQVQHEYKYTESVPKQRFTIKQIAISVCIGLLVYVVLMFFSKKGKQKK